MNERANTTGLQGYYATSVRNTQETLKMCQESLANKNKNSYAPPVKVRRKGLVGL